MSDQLSISVTDYGESVHVFADVSCNDLHASAHYDRRTDHLREQFANFRASVDREPVTSSLQFGDQNLWLKLHFEASEEVPDYELVARVEIQEISFRAQIKTWTTLEQLRDFSRALTRNLDEATAFPAILQFVGA